MCSVEIDLPIDKVVKLFDNNANLKEWQDGFIGIEHLSGKSGKSGAKSKLKYKTGKRNMELIETIVSKNLPDEFTATYEHTAMLNTMTTRFVELYDNRTKYYANIEYTKFNRLMPNLMAKMMPGMFKKQVQKWMDQFKTFAEKEK